MLKSVIFDCDGVMFDTARANRAYYDHLLKKFERPQMSESQFEFVHMHTVDEALAHLFPEPAILAAVRSYRLTVDYLPYLKLLQIEPGLKPLLRRLQPAYKTAVATNRTDTMQRLLGVHGLVGAFDMVVCAWDVARPKPHPDSLMHILSSFQLAPREAIYIGDSTVDQAAAAAARIPFVAYRNPGLQAAHHIRALSEMETLLDL
jgi:HAD superfamily hydrolase (TIGR01509 family)